MTRLVTVALLALALGTVGCSKEAPPEPAPVVRPVKIVTLGAAEQRDLVFPGKTRAVDRSVLSFRVSGQLVEFPVDEGQEVRRGQLVARLDPTDFQIAVDEARAAFRKAQADYDRYKRLYEREAVPLAELEMRRAMRDVARSQLDQAEANLGYTRLLAPYSGVVGKKFVENFERVSAGQPIASLQNLEIIEIVVDVPEDLMARTAGGRNATFFARFEAAPGREFPLAFKESAAQADPATQTYEVTFTMKQPEGVRVLPGMTAEVVVRGEVSGTASGNRIAIPVSAVVADDSGNARVWVVDPDTGVVHSRSVKLGEPTGQNEVWVLEGLEPGEAIAVAAVHELKEGETVRPLPETY